ncbi:MAG: Holliday junction resolvase RuvX [Porticoccaceae bacterium]
MPDSHKAVLAFDFGLKQIGVAQGHTLIDSANGLTIIKASDGSPDWLAISEIIEKWQPDLLLVGLPLNMDNSESELSQKARRFARRLEGRFNIQVMMIDERLTSREAKSIVYQHQRGSGRKSRTQDLTKIDHLAAALILQGWLQAPELGQKP